MHNLLQIGDITDAMRSRLEVVFKIHKLGEGDYPNEKAERAIGRAPYFGHILAVAHSQLLE